MLRAGPCQEAAGRVSHPARAGKRRAGDANAINLSKPERPRCPPTANIYTAPDYAPRALNNTASARPAGRIQRLLQAGNPLKISARRD